MFLYVCTVHTANVAQHDTNTCQRLKDVEVSESNSSRAAAIQAEPNVLTAFTSTNCSIPVIIHLCFHLYKSMFLWLNSWHAAAAGVCALQP
jgi:hypothetical protein